MAKKLSGLGKGLDALFPVDFEKADVLSIKDSPPTEVDIDLLVPMKDQPRTVFDKEKIDQLAYSIKEHGVIQPLIVVEHDGGYQIIAGERRYRASKKAGLTKLPVVIRKANTLEKLQIALIENIQREDLNAIDQALSIKRLHEEFSISYEDIGKSIGKAESTVINLYRLLGLPAPIQQALKDFMISEGHARSLLALTKDPEVQNILFRHIIKDGWSVRQAELFVRAHKGTGGKKELRAQKMLTKTDDTKKLEARLKRDVRIQRTSKGGKLVITFRDDADLAKLLKEL